MIWHLAFVGAMVHDVVPEAVGDRHVHKSADRKCYVPDSRAYLRAR